MKYIIENTGRKAAYLQLYSMVRDDIVGGIYGYNEKLPSKRLMAAETGVSTVTVEHAYALLCDEGYIEARERSGYFVVFHNGDGFFPPSGAAGKIPFSFEPPRPHRTGETNPQFPFSVLVKTMRRVMSDYGERILEKSPNAGRDELREAIRNYLAQSRGIIADTEQIIIGSGSEYLYSLIVELLGRERTYAIESPSYKKIEQVYLASDVKHEKLPLGCDGIESEALWKSLADILHISPYRSFPSGVTATASKRHEYMRWASGASSNGSRYIIEDDFESEFSVSKKPEETLFSASAGENVIYLNTFSMTVSPSLRVGYMVLPKPLLPSFREKIGFYSCTVPTYIQFVLAELISNGDFTRHINRVRREKRNELKKR